MRKQTKVVAVASAAALLAIGASMTSFAANGWVEEDGVWYWYDSDGNKVEDVWKKSGDNWYWLDGEDGGAMAVDKLIEDDDDIYYVDSNGAMVKNTWVKVVNEDQDDDEDPAEYIYYYMQSNGKAYKSGTNSTTTKFKTIDGKRYCFDEDGKMLYGWVDGNHERVDRDNWIDASYYLGSWEDGSLKTGWQKITVEDNEDDDEEKEFWFNFKSNGVKRTNDDVSDPDVIKEVKINGKKYGFDYRGVMVYEWTLTTNSSAAASASSWKYFNSPEDGARATKGWFKVAAPEEDNDNTFKNYGEGRSFAITDANDETDRWYYADTDGKLVEGEIKKIKGKYYGFRPDDDFKSDGSGQKVGKGAAMLSGLVLLDMDPNDESKILTVIDDDVDADDLEDILNDEYTALNGYSNATLFYFGNDEDTDGAMKTGNVTVNLDGDSYNFLFSKSGGAEGKGRGMTGIDDNKYIYKYGCRIKADSDDKYLVVHVDPGTGRYSDSVDVNAPGVTVTKVRSSDLRDMSNVRFVNDDEETVNATVLSDYTEDTVNHGRDNYLYLVNTSGAVQKNKVAAKDGDDWYFYVKDRTVRMYTNIKNQDVKTTPTTAEDWENTIRRANKVNTDSYTR